MASGNAAPEDAPSGHGRWIWTGWLALMVAHVGLAWRFGAAQLLSSEPYFGHDFNTHIVQTWRVLEGIEGWGQSWVYDARFLAGTPNGIFFDADNKGWEVFTLLGTWLGAQRGTAFNAFVLLAHVAGPPTVGWAARRLGVGHLGALVAGACASALWFFDSWNHWCWYVGMVAYAFASFAHLVPLVAFIRWEATRAPGWWILAALSLWLVHLLHPYAFFMLAPPMLAVAWTARRRLGRAGWTWALAMAALTVVGNAWWLATAARFWHYILDSAFFGGGGLPFLGADLAGWMIDPSSTGLIGTRTLLRLIIVSGAFMAWWGWRREGDARAVPVGASLWTLSVMAYLGTYTPLEQVQPYRHVGPLGFLACVPLGALVERFVHARRAAALPRTLRPMAALLIIGASLGVVREASYFLGSYLPRPEPVPGTTRSMLDMTGHPWTPRYAYERMDLSPVHSWVERHDDGRGRILVEGPLYGEFLAWSTDAQIVGGFAQRNVRHAWANLFRWDPLGQVGSDELRRYLETYAIHWIIVTSPGIETPWWDTHTDVLEPAEPIGPWRTYRVRRPSSLATSGASDVDVRASTNRIEVVGSDPQHDVFLRYQWLETLACRPDCEVSPREETGRRMPLMVVPAPHPADFEIYNAY